MVSYVVYDTLRGALSNETAQIADGRTYMLHEYCKVDLAVWRRPARAVCEVLMTKFSCFALAAADMKHVQHVESRSASV